MIEDIGPEVAKSLKAFLDEPDTQEDTGLCARLASTSMSMMLTSPSKFPHRLWLESPLLSQERYPRAGRKFRLTLRLREPKHHLLFPRKQII